eukprot:gene13268-13376_t
MAKPDIVKPAASLELAALTKSYGSTRAVDSIDLKIPAGTYCCLLGPSGCGKTSTLRMIAGHETVSSGDIILGPQNFSIRADRLDLVSGIVHEANSLPATITEIEYQGTFVQVSLKAATGEELIANLSEAAFDAHSFQISEQVTAKWQDSAIHAFT